MSNHSEVFVSIRNGNLINDIDKFNRDQLEPYLPYLWSLTGFCDTPHKNEFSDYLDKVRSKYIDYSIGNQFSQYFHLDLVLIEKELMEFRDSGTYHVSSNVHFSNMDPKDKLLYIGKQMIILMSSTSQGINANEVKNFEPFDQEVFHSEVVFIITLLCHFFPLHFTINRFDCCMLAYKYGPELITRIIMNQPSTFDSVLLQFMDLKMSSSTKIGIKRDITIYNLLSLEKEGAQIYLPTIFESDVHFSLCINLLCSDLITDDTFVCILISHFSKQDDKFTQQLAKSQKEEIQKLDTRIKQVAVDLPLKMNELSSKLIILMTIRYSHRAFTLNINGIEDVIKFIANRELNETGYLSLLTTGFIISFFVAGTLMQRDRELESELCKQAELFFKKLGKLIELKNEKIESFKEFMLLSAIHFKSNNEQELSELLSSTLGFKINYGKINFKLLADIFLNNAINTKDFAKLASQISVTYDLTSHVTGYLPAHCIDYLLSERTFATNNVSIASWIERQILNCKTPIHPIIVSVLRKYANSCTPIEKGGICNPPLSHYFFQKLFQNDIFNEEELAPYLLSFYFICGYNAVANRCDFQNERLYRTSLIEMIPIRYLMSKMDEYPDKYKALRGPMMILVADYMTPYMSKLDEDLKKIQIIDDINDKEYKQNLLEKAIKIVEHLPKSMNEFEKLLNYLIKLPTSQLANYIKLISLAFYKTLDFQCSIPILEKIIKIWIQQETILPQKLYEETLKLLLSAGDKEIQNVTISNEYIINEPARILRCDERALKSPPHFECIIRMLDFYLILAQRYQKKIYEKVFYKYGPEQKEKVVEVDMMQKAYYDTQCLFVIQLLIEFCDEEINPNENILEIRQIALSFVNKILLLIPYLIEILHLQGYPVKNIPIMIDYVESCHVIVNKLPEMMKVGNMKKRIFFIHFVIHLFKKFRLPLFAGYAQMMLVYIKEQLEILDTSERIIFAYNVLKPLEMLAELLPFSITEIVDLIEKAVTIAKNRSALYPSLLQARKSPEKIFIDSAKLFIRNIKKLEQKVQ